MEFKQYILERCIGKRLRFKCNCVMMMNFVGTIVDGYIRNNEIIFKIDVDGRLIEIGENHPGMMVE